MRAVLLMALALSIVGGAHADEGASDDKRRAKALYDAGVRKYNLSEFQTALVDFKSAYELHPDPALLFNIGQCHRMLGHAQEAAYAYRAYLRELPDAPNREEVERLRAAMEQQVHRKVDVTPPATTAERPAANPPGAQASPRSTSATAAAPTHHRPLYKRWWLWTAVGAVAAIAVGVGVGVGAAPAQDAPNPGGTAGSGVVRF
jgi:tetratricopeptide (TPR) repeat protein